tara:strand:- start:2817 stop:4286 length:1470 start_codon:yes stop_codon:yes gene_type:complete
MATIIEQEPQYQVMPVGQDVIFVVSNNPIVANEKRVKFIAEVHVSSGNPPNLSSPNDIVGTFKVTPNNAGVGIFDFSSVIENFVSADNMASTKGAGGTYKGTSSQSIPFSMHLIDKFSRNDNTVRWMAIQFKIEYLGATPCSISTPQDDNVVAEACGEAVNTNYFTLWNGYLKYTDKIVAYGSENQNFGYDWQSQFLLNGTSKRFLTNAPTTQYANLEDYGTMAFIAPEIIRTDTGFEEMDRVTFSFFDSSGSALGSHTLQRTYNNGAFDNAQVPNSHASTRLLYLGVFPGNLQNWSSVFQGLVAAGTVQGGHYTITGRDSSLNVVTQTYTIDLNCPDLKNYESIRLCWLNQWGAWDYFTFTKKSTRNISTQGSTYSQLEGTWNQRVYRNYGYKGGKKSFRVNALEKITMNTDFVSEDFNTIFEELVNSPEVYMLDGFQTDAAQAVLNTYVTPVRLTTSNFTKKTVANDKLIQYTFEIEKSKTLRTQSI